MRIQLLNHENRHQIEELCKIKEGYNFFILASLDFLSTDQNLVEYWGQFDELGNLEGILMRYNVLWYVCDTPNTDVKTFVEIIESKKQPAIILNDNLIYSESLVKYFKGYSTKLDLPGRLIALNAGRFNYKTEIAARKADLDDIDRLTEFYASAPEDVKRRRDSIRRSITDGRRTFILEVDNKIVSCALTTAELSDKAMIGGLHVLPLDRSSEYLELVLLGIIQELLHEGKIPYIVVRDPFIDSVCKKIGFEEIGTWRMIHMDAI